METEELVRVLRGMIREEARNAAEDVARRIVREEVTAIVDARVTAIIDERVPKIIDERVPKIIDERVPSMIREAVRESEERLTDRIEGVRADVLRLNRNTVHAFEQLREDLQAHGIATRKPPRPAPRAKPPTAAE